MTASDLYEAGVRFAYGSLGVRITIPLDRDDLLSALRFEVHSRVGLRELVTPDDAPQTGACVDCGDPLTEPVTVDDYWCALCAKAAEKAQDAPAHCCSCGATELAECRCEGWS